MTKTSRSRRAMATIGLMLGAAGLLALTPAAPALAGPFKSALHSQFCRSLPYHQRVGCDGYLQYRIERGKDRDYSNSTCKWGCAQVLSDPSAIEDCRKGCAEANSKDN